MNFPNNHYASPCDYRMDPLSSQPAVASWRERTAAADPSAQFSHVQGIYQKKVANNWSSLPLRAPCNTYTPGKEFYSPVAYNKYSAYAQSIWGSFDITRLPQTPYIDLIRNQVPLLAYQGQPHISLAKVLKRTAYSVGALQHPSGSLGTATLIGVNMILVPRHSIAGICVNEMEVEFGYFEGRGRSYKVSHVLESSPVLDYAVLVVEGDPGRTYPPATLDFQEGSIARDLPLLHHPFGRPLQVSVHFFGPQNLSPSSETNHDSDYGSSGGSYLNHRGNVIAMHLGSEMNHRHSNLVRHAITLREIAQQIPDGVLAQLADGRMRQDVAYETMYPVYYLQPAETAFLLDEEGRISQEKLTKRIGRPPGINFKRNKSGQISTQYRSDVERIKKYARAHFDAVVSECLNQGGVHADIKQFSITGTIESDHVPPYDVWKHTTHPNMRKIIRTGTGNRKGENEMPAVSIPCDAHRDLLTTGSSHLSEAFRQKQIDLCNLGKIADAISLNLDDYDDQGLLPAYNDGVVKVLHEHVRLGTITLAEKRNLMATHGLT